MSSKVIRQASHAGSWYQKDGKKLSAQLEDWLDTVPDTPETGSAASAPLPITSVRAIIAPGPPAAYAYKCIDPHPIERVFILGPSHHAYLDGCALSQCDEYETPIGNLKLDVDVIAELAATGEFQSMDLETDEAEHSIEMHLPYVYKVMEEKEGPYTIIPVLVGSIQANKEEKYGRLLAPYLADPHNLFVVSSDFCHWGRRFDYTFKGELHKADSPPPIHKCIEALDREGMSIIEKIDPAAFTAYLKRTRNTICGRHPIGVLLNATSKVLGETGKKRAEIKFTHYSQSSKVTSERDSSVSYASAYVRID
ncbi:hypothetical protein HDV00_009979 [Rhizophlyctis rosea]|nr:hypothetical protein HDV00_009979 [Rhizophlyctis rosea]